MNKLTWGKFQSAVAAYFFLYLLALIWRYWTSHNWHAGIDASFAVYLIVWTIRDKHREQTYREIFSDFGIVAVILFMFIIIGAAIKW